MRTFSTEFPVASNKGPASFLAEVIAWLRGTPYSTVLASNPENELDRQNAFLRSPAGEQLRLREIKGQDEWVAIGFRHDYPDSEGRLWRTEGVLRNQAGFGTDNLIRLRTQCIAHEANAHLENPRKPYLIRALLKNAWDAGDGILQVSDQPIWLKDDTEGLQLARAVTLGSATEFLPVVYVSAVAVKSWLLTAREIERLAYDLGGVAHVVVEPNRAFSFALKDQTDAQNAYGGAIGLSLPGKGVVRRFNVGWQAQDASELIVRVRSTALGARSSMPSRGWDWSELQEQALRQQRTQEQKKLTSVESEQLYIEEIENLQETIKDLKSQIENSSVDPVGDDQSEFSNENLVRLVGPEIYVGEVSDRLRYAANQVLLRGEAIGLDLRTKLVLESFVNRVPVSGALKELLQDLERVTKDQKRFAPGVIALLERHGYEEKSDNKHIRLQAQRGFEGLDVITIPKTPSDHRAPMNLRKQVERTLGLGKLQD